MKNSLHKQLIFNVSKLKAMLHGAIFLATCDAILLLRDVKISEISEEF